MHDMNQDNNWVTEIDYINLLAVYDVVLDIKEFLDLKTSPLSIQIPIRPIIVRFPELQPSKMPAVIKRYEELRSRALDFLKEKAILSLVIKDAFGIQAANFNVFANKPALLGMVALLKQELQRRKGAEVQPQKMANSDFWDRLHPSVVKFAKPRFTAGHLADSVEACLKEINAVVKARNKERTGKEFDGADLMRNTFSPKNPVIALADLSTESGKKEQQGYMDIFAGSMIGIRNPKAHGNVVIDEKRAVHLLYLASLLMYKLDEAK